MQANVVKNAPYSRANPFQSKVLKNINLNGDGSNKETRHLELSLKGSGLTYKPGDALGVYPENDPELVAAIIEEMKWDEDATVTINKDETVTIKEALTKLDITNLNRKVMRETAKLSDNADLKGIVEDSAKVREYVDGRDFLDLLRDFGPWSASAQELISVLGKLLPRLYSIASSISAHEDEVHLTIGAVRYTAHGRERKGVCSVQCSERVSEGDTLPVFVQPNRNFFLPEDESTNIIMVGPGTGIAPFRSFIEELAVTKTSGKAWLFFGDQHEATDYLYKEELEQYVEDGVLAHVTTAFSRDSDEKVYVQHRMLENSKEIFDWLENGAYFYVCGDKTYMAKDVNEALIAIAEKEGNMSREDAEEYVKKLSGEGRYQRDVY